MKCSSPFFQALFLTKSLKRNQINFARVAARASGLRGNTVQATRVRQNKPGTAFGGADSRRIATAQSCGNPLRQTLFPVYFGVLVWLGRYFREARLRALLPLRS